MMTSSSSWRVFLRPRARLDASYRPEQRATAYSSLATRLGTMPGGGARPRCPLVLPEEWKGAQDVFSASWSGGA